MNITKRMGLILPNIMLATSFDKDSLGWQFQQLQQRIREWLELKLTPTVNKALNSVGLPPDWVWDVLLKIFWILLAIVAVWLGLTIYRNLRPYFSLLIKTSTVGKSEITQPQYHPITEWLKQVRKFQSQGNYSEACRCLYMAMLQKLNDTEIIPNQLSRTDGEYISLINNMSNIREIQFLITTHEQICFGNANISADVFARCQQAYQEMDNKLIKNAAK